MLGVRRWGGVVTCGAGRRGPGCGVADITSDRTGGGWPGGHREGLQPPLRRVGATRDRRVRIGPTFSARSSSQAQRLPSGCAAGPPLARYVMTATEPGPDTRGPSRIPSTRFSLPRAFSRNLNSVSDSLPRVLPPGHGGHPLPPTLKPHTIVHVPSHPP